MVEYPDRTEWPELELRPEDDHDAHSRAAAEVSAARRTYMVRHWLARIDQAAEFGQRIEWIEGLGSLVCSTCTRMDGLQQTLDQAKRQALEPQERWCGYTRQTLQSGIDLEDAYCRCDIVSSDSDLGPDEYARDEDQPGSVPVVRPPWWRRLLTRLLEY
jgi:hypothetical protein